MTKLTTVEACCGCPWAQVESRPIFEPFSCRYALYTCQAVSGKPIFDHDTIPEWCPLEDEGAQVARIRELETMLRELVSAIDNPDSIEVVAVLEAAEALLGR